ncbi:hypothetical protein FGM00_12910 [Aggregatimonas sangjinii]|uniref:Uncharacterized protein n=1 Tax=Aggregatimonas sangjinii TaxID=2583587 RepID=A0A5B7SQX2_9FLAO|nr:contractile injection system tape measure protein [Aggregatimonas sangjinii]QCX00967.1 hypothetical protein FGM00_12910 [Aggregatimonas sangjinii]
MSNPISDLMGGIRQNNIQEAQLDFKIQNLATDGINGNDFVAWAKTNILEVLDCLATEYTKPETVVLMEELTLDLQLTVQNDLFSEGEKVRDTISRQLRAALKKALAENNISCLTHAHHNAKLVLGYLEQGLLTSCVSDEEWDGMVTSFYGELAVNQEVRFKWVQTIKNKHAFIRFFRLKSVPEQHELVAQLTSEIKVMQRINAYLKLFTANPDYFLSLPLIEFYYTLFTFLPNNNWSLGAVLQLMVVQHMIPDKITSQNLTIPKIILAEVSAALEQAPTLKDHPFGNSTEREEQGIKEVPGKNTATMQHGTEVGAYIGQAGLVLLAHFLPQFLKKVGYLNEKGQLIDAVEVPILFHYMATGESSAPEWKLTLPKILAGLDPGEHCNTALRPVKNLDTEITEFLKAIIGHWKALKNTSPDGLRETFLVREGVLKSKNGFYYLHIPEQTVDILLPYIPWNYTTIRLQWMQNILFVAWNKS